jgi:serine phosphatase RsbU (regulator of sigma subunit)
VQRGLITGALILLVLMTVIFRSLQANKKKNRIITEQKLEVENQKHIVEEKQKEIVDSINYAKRIQLTLLAHKEMLDENLGEHFVLFKPKDIVSGDFYWATKKGDLFFLAVCDSTGHGVPGAFMCLLNIGFLTEAINENDIHEPHKVLDYVRERLIRSISKDGQKDGFDGILACFNQKTGEITYAAANNAPLIIHNGEYLELPADRMPVGKGERTESFKLYNITYTKGDTLYLYTDGYADQFGGPKGKKFMYKRLNTLAADLSVQPLNEQVSQLNETFHSWKGNLEQIDDVCIIGIKM